MSIGSTCATTSTEKLSSSTQSSCPSSPDGCPPSQTRAPGGKPVLNLEAALVNDCFTTPVEPYAEWGFSASELATVPYYYPQPPMADFAFDVAPPYEAPDPAIAVAYETDTPPPPQG